MGNLLGRTLPVFVDGREVMGTVGRLGKGNYGAWPPVYVVKYELNGERDWTFVPESLLRRALERKEGVHA